MVVYVLEWGCDAYEIYIAGVYDSEEKALAAWEAQKDRNHVYDITGWVIE